MAVEPDKPYTQIKEQEVNETLKDGKTDTH
jgi:hypothetical protein